MLESYAPWLDPAEYNVQGVIQMNRNSPDQDIDSKYEEIRSMILTAANAAIPQSRPQPSGGSRLIGGWWNAECEEATAEKRRVLRTFKRNMTEENRELVRAATTHCSEVAEKARQEHWERFCTEQVQEPKDSSKLWRMVRAHRRRGRRPAGPRPAAPYPPRGGPSPA